MAKRYKARILSEKNGNVIILGGRGFESHATGRTTGLSPGAGGCWRLGQVKQVERTGYSLNKIEPVVGGSI